ncbi:MAG: DNA-deoxyinosine glycosylase, partial [Bacillota bacterium]|nr:DNA-deoxyinosine glycosylase [Bacillota bacterium]
SVKNVQPNDIPGLLAKCPRITAVAFNGTLSTRLYSSHFPKQEGMTYIQLPSTSPIPRPGMAAYEDVLCAWKEALSSCTGK